MDRYLIGELRRHFAEHRPMAFPSGPRQVGKTTIARRSCEGFDAPDGCLNWDNQDHRTVLLGGPARLVEHIGLDRLRSGPAFCALDYSFSVRPWHRNVSRALRKEPKYYLRDRSLVTDEGARAENLVAAALLNDDRAGPHVSRAAGPRSRGGRHDARARRDRRLCGTHCLKV